MDVFIGFLFILGALAVAVGAMGALVQKLRSRPAGPWAWMATAGLVAVALGLFLLPGAMPQDRPARSQPAAQAAETRPNALSAADLKAILDSLRANFSGTSWYPLIAGIEAGGSSLVVKTAIYPDAEGRQYARELCTAVLANARVTLTGKATGGRPAGAIIYAQGNDPVARCE